MRIDDAVGEIVKTTESTRALEDEEPQISATITINKANIKTVQNFLWTLTEKAMIDKFEFDESAATTKIKSTIAVNEFDANLAIVKQCFALLMADPNENTDALTLFSLTALPTHLDFLREDPGLKSMHATDKREIGKGVFSLLVDGEIIERHWGNNKTSDYYWFDEDYDGKYSWFYSKGGSSVFWKWLDDPEAIRYLGKKDKEWLKELKSTPDPNQSLLKPITLLMARRWLTDREWNAFNTFQWINRYLEMVHCSQTLRFHELIKYL